MKPENNTKLARRRVGVCAAIALGLGAGTAAAEQETSYRVAAIKDSAYGHLILKADFDTAIERLEKRDRKGIDAFYTATNLCVAYIKTGELELAESICTLAVEEIETVLADRMRIDTAAELQGVRRFLALALSNRGVARAVNGRHALARADFEAAGEIESRLNEPAINLSRLTRPDTSGA